MAQWPCLIKTKSLCRIGIIEYSYVFIHTKINTGVYSIQLLMCKRQIRYHKTHIYLIKIRKDNISNQGAGAKIFFIMIFTLPMKSFRYVMYFDTTPHTLIWLWTDIVITPMEDINWPFCCWGKYSRRTRSIPWLLMSLLLPSLGHQQSRYWLYMMNGVLYSMRKVLNFWPCVVPMSDNDPIQLLVSMKEWMETASGWPSN